MKFARFVPLWQKSHRDDVSDGWKISQDQMLRDYVLPLLGKRNLAAIKELHILKVLNAMKELGRGAQTRIHVFNLMFRIFKDAITLHKLRKTNPVLPEFRPKLTYKATPYLHPEHAFMLLAHVIGHRYEAAFFLLVLTAIRIGECQGLTWNHVDFRNKQIHIKQQYCRKTKTIVARTKNGRDLYVPMPKLLFHKLMKLKKQSGYVATGTNKMMQQMSFHKALKRACRELGIPEVSAHGLRHSSTEIWVDKGASAMDIQRLLNHVSGKSTPRYIHRADRTLMAIADKIGRLKKVG